jgi:hypothetical protein
VDTMRLVLSKAELVHHITIGSRRDSEGSTKGSKIGCGELVVRTLFGDI